MPLLPINTCSNCSKLSGCRFGHSHASLNTYHIIRVVLHIWDSLPRAARGSTTGQPLQHTNEFGEVSSLLRLLESILRTFEVATFSVLDSTIG